jgi:hypothetical protein
MDIKNHKNAIVALQVPGITNIIGSKANQADLNSSCDLNIDNYFSFFCAL